MLAPRLEELTYRELVHDQSGGERPIAGLGGVPHGFPEPSVALTPPGRPLVQAGQLSRAFDPELETQHRGEQGVVAVPSIAERADELVRPRQRRQGVRPPLVTG